MKRIYIILIGVSITFVGAHAQVKERYMNVKKTEGSIVKFKVKDVENITFEEINKPEDKARHTFIVNGISFTMIKVEGGTFQMGKSGKSDDGNDVTPVHEVTLTDDYYIGETEVTQELWQAVMGDTPNTFYKGKNIPVFDTTWDACQVFIQKLNKMTGYNFRLPTEAEWEFAAKGGTWSNGYTFSGSNSIEDVAWCYPDSGEEPHEVATKRPNELGIYDMSGNVWEWCQDWWGYYCNEGALTNPSGPSSGILRVYRGGSTGRPKSDCRPVIRYGLNPFATSSFIGLRLAL